MGMQNAWLLVSDKKNLRLSKSSLEFVFSPYYTEVKINHKRDL